MVTTPTVAGGGPPAPPAAGAPSLAPQAAKMAAMGNNANRAGYMAPVRRLETATVHDEDMENPFDKDRGNRGAIRDWLGCVSLDEHNKYCWPWRILVYYTYVVECMYTNF
jgi:hypothetical protein